MPFAKRLVPAGLVVLLALVLCSGAEAKVPKFKNKSIVTGVSIGGLKVGMSKAKANKAWGKPDRCQDSPIWCQYLATGTINGFTNTQPFAGYYLKGGKVVAVGVEYADNPSVDAKVVKLKTSKGIHLGSSMSDVRSKYGLGPASGGEAGLSRAIVKKGNRCTLFYAPTSPYSKVEAIQVGICGAAGLV
jgi:hypothetical protein